MTKDDVRNAIFKAFAEVPKPEPEAVLNGIAYDAAADRLFVTGKLWPKIFEIQIVPKK